MCDHDEGWELEVVYNSSGLQRSIYGHTYQVHFNHHAECEQLNYRFSEMNGKEFHLKGASNESGAYCRWWSMENVKKRINSADEDRKGT